MDKKRIEIIITSVLVLIFIFVWINSIKLMKKKSKAKVKPVVTVPSVSIPEIPLAELKDKDLSKDEDLKWVRCPFSGKQYGEEIAIGFDVSGIIWDEANPKAIINGQILSEGDSIGEYLIEKIGKQKVILTDGQRQIELNI